MHVCVCLYSCKTKIALYIHRRRSSNIYIAQLVHNENVISCRCVILTNYGQFTLLRLSQNALFADALFFLMRAVLFTIKPGL